MKFEAKESRTIKAMVTVGETFILKFTSVELWIILKSFITLSMNRSAPSSFMDDIRGMLESIKFNGVPLYKLMTSFTVGDAQELRTEEYTFTSGNVKLLEMLIMFRIDECSSNDADYVHDTMIDMKVFRLELMEMRLSGLEIEPITTDAIPLD